MHDDQEEEAAAHAPPEDFSISDEDFDKKSGGLTSPNELEFELEKNTSIALPKSINY